MPYQFIAKMYTEALGRIPDQTAWNYNVNAISYNQPYYDNMVRAFYEGAESKEFKQLYPLSDAWCFKARLLALYRGVLSREPNQNEFDYYIGRLQNNPSDWDQILEEFINGSEYQHLILLTVLNAQQNFPYYSFVYNRPLNINTGTDLNINNFKCDSSNSGQELQTFLDNHKGQTIYLAPMAVIYLTSSLTIPDNTTLCTAGLPSPNHYAKMARIVRDGILNDDMIKLSPGSKITNVWIDAQRPRFAREALYTSIKYQVYNQSASHVYINNNRLSDASGWAAIYFYPARALNTHHDNNYLFTDFQVKSNLITGYGTEHIDGYSDGINTGCEDTYIENNQIVDMTDGSITIFASDSVYNGHTQHSQVQNNLILNSGNSSYYGIVISGELENNTQPGIYTNFQGMLVQNNIIWTSPGAHIDRVLEIGDRPIYWNNDNYLPNERGKNGTVQNNNSGICKLIANVCTELSGFGSVNISNNYFSVYDFDSFFSQPVGQSIKSTDARWDSYIGNQIFTSYPDTIFLFNTGHTDGLYISGPDTVYKNEVVTFRIKKIKGYYLQESNCRFLIWDWNGSWHQTIDGSSTLTINTANYPYSLWIRFDELNKNDQWRNKYVTYIPQILFKDSDSELKSTANTPLEYSLSNNYPNPFNPTTQIVYTLKEKGFVRLQVYNILGQKVADLVDQVQNDGMHEVTFDGSDLSSGIYIYRLQANAYTMSRKLLLMK